MKTISRYIMTLALLLTAVGGAWAQSTVQCSLDDITIEPGGSATTNFNLTNPDDKFCACQFTIQFPQGISIAYDTDEEEYVASLIRNRMKHHSLDVVYNSVYSVTVASNQDFQGTEGPLINFSIVADNNAVAGNYDCYITNVKLTKTEGDPVTFESIPFKVTISGSEPADGDNTVEVTTNAASEQDLFTEAWFKMPTFDATVNYMLVRDMQDETNPVIFTGLPTTTTAPIIVKKGSDGKYQPAEALTIQLIDPLAAAEAQNIIAADGITIKVLVGDDSSLPIEYDHYSPITLEAFLADMKPGYYWIKAEQTDENSPYDGTVYSSEFTVVEKYDLLVKPANDFSKGKVESVTVGSGSVTIDANTGKATKTGIAPETEVKIKAKRGYVIDKVEVKKGIAPPDPVTVTWNNLNFNSNPYTRDGVTLTTTGNAASANNFNNGGDKTFTNTIGKFTKIEIVCEANNFDGWAKESAGGYQVPEGPYVEVFKLTWTGNAESVTIPGGNYLYGISSITFTIQ